MTNQVILIALAVIVVIITIAFVFLTLRKSKVNGDFSQASTDGKGSSELMSKDFRSKKIKCTRCGGSAYGVLGVENVYRCSSCGYKSVIEGTESGGS